MLWVSAAVASALLSGVAFYFDALAQLAAQDARNGASVLAQLSGTMLGFVLAALAILTTLGNTALVSNMQVTGHFSSLLRRMLGCVAAFGVVTVGGVILLFVPTLKTGWLYFLVSAAIFAAILLADVCQKLWLVLHNLNVPPPP